MHRTFSWLETKTGAEVFEVQRIAEPRPSQEVWERSQTLAVLHQPNLLLEVCVEALKRQGWGWVPPESNLLRRAFASQLRTDPRSAPESPSHDAFKHLLQEPVPAESTADPEEAFSGRGRS